MPLMLGMRRVNMSEQHVDEPPAPESQEPAAVDTDRNPSQPHGFWRHSEALILGGGLVLVLLIMTVAYIFTQTEKDSSRGAHLPDEPALDSEAITPTSEMAPEANAPEEIEPTTTSSETGVEEVTETATKDQDETVSDLNPVETANPFTDTYKNPFE